MSSEVVVERLTVLIETKFVGVDRKFAEVNGRLHSVERQLRVIWAILLPAHLALIAGLLAAVPH